MTAPCGAGSTSGASPSARAPAGSADDGSQSPQCRVHRFAIGKDVEHVAIVSRSAAVRLRLALCLISSPLSGGRPPRRNDPRSGRALQEGYHQQLPGSCVQGAASTRRGDRGIGGTARRVPAGRWGSPRARSPRSLEQALGEVLVGLRHSAGLSQERVAEIAGISTFYLRQLERGQKSATVGTLVGLSMALSKQPHELLESAEQALKA